MSKGWKILGIDFTSAPRRAKPITVASGAVRKGALHIELLEEFTDFQAFDRLLARPGPWLGGFDFPFGLPRELVEHLRWPHRQAGKRGPWERLVRHLQALPRERMVAAFRAWCDARPPGSKFAHRATDLRAGSSPSMKWVNPPVAFMLQAGAPRLLAAGVTIPGMQAGDPERVALEAYPGMLARTIVGRRSYKSDTAAGRTAERAQARCEIVMALQDAVLPGLALRLHPLLRERCIDDPRGDLLDAVLCAVQAGWGWQRREQGYGLPDRIDPVEGWILNSPHAPVSETPAAAPASL
jgi:hypothetical protein